jgi:hypothetical protein
MKINPVYLLLQQTLDIRRLFSPQLVEIGPGRQGGEPYPASDGQRE